MVLDLIKRSRTQILSASALSVAAGAANIWLLALVARDLGQIDSSPNAVVVYAGALMLMVAVGLISQIALARLSARMLHGLRQQLVLAITQLSIRKVEAIGRHRLYAALTRDVPAVHELLVQLPNYIFNTTVVVACLIYLATVSPRLFLVFFALLVVGLYVAKFTIADRAEKRFEQRRGIENELFRCYEAVIDGGKELKLNRGREKWLLDQELAQHAGKYRDITMSAETLLSVSNYWATAIVFIGVGALLYLSPHIGVNDRAPVVTFVMTIFYIVGPLTILINAFRTVHGARVAIRHLSALELDTGAPAGTTRARTEAAEPFQMLSARGLSFHYDSQDEGRAGFNVGPLDFDIARGEIVYFVGGNGSGKTTAAKLLTGLYGKHTGSLLVNGAEPADTNAFFHYFSAVFQDYYLFETLVAKPGKSIDPDEVRVWLDMLDLTGKVTVEHGRLSTTKLSYGQRKRLALLIVYFEQSDIYVFDEWAADQDAEFREFFYSSFLPGLKKLGKTAIVVSHDDRYFHLADTVMKFESGRIVSITRSGPAASAAVERHVAMDA